MTHALTSKRRMNPMDFMHTKQKSLFAKQQQTANRISVADFTKGYFIKFPSFLFNKYFKGLINSDAKLTYMLLKERISLSLKNGARWVDKKGKVFCYLSREELADLLNVSINTVTKAMKSLVNVGLIEEERQGMGRPNRIYIVTPANINFKDEHIYNEYLEENFDSPTAETDDNEEFALAMHDKASNNAPSQRITNFVNHEPQTADKNHKSCESRIANFVNHESQNLGGNKTYKNQTYDSHSHVMSHASDKIESQEGQRKDINPPRTITFKIHTDALSQFSDSVKIPPQVIAQVPGLPPPLITSFTENIKKMASPQDCLLFDQQTYPQKRKTTKSDEQKYNTQLKEIQEQIDYESLTDEPANREFLDSIVKIMRDVIYSNLSEIKVNGEFKPISIVRGTFLKLNYEHIEFVISKFKEQAHEIKRITSYLRTMLYNSVHEMEFHYDNLVRSHYGRYSRCT